MASLQNHLFLLRGVHKPQRSVALLLTIVKTTQVTLHHTPWRNSLIRETHPGHRFLKLGAFPWWNVDVMITRIPGALKNSPYDYDNARLGDGLPSSLGVRKDGKPLEGRGRKALAETLLGGKVSWTQLNTRCNEQRNSSGLRQEWCLKRVFLMHWSSFDKGILYLEFQHVLGFREPQRNIHLLSNEQIKFLSKRLHDSHLSPATYLRFT